MLYSHYIHKIKLLLTTSFFLFFLLLLKLLKTKIRNLIFNHAVHAFSFHFLECICVPILFLVHNMLGVRSLAACHMNIHRKTRVLASMIITAYTLRGFT